MSVTINGDYGLTVSSNAVFTDSSGRVGIGTGTPTYTLSFIGTAAKTIGLERNTNVAPAITTGQNLTISAGAATAGVSNRTGGTLTLSAGLSTGSQGSTIVFSTATFGSSGSSDNTPSEKMRIDGYGNIGIGSVLGLFAPNSADRYIALNSNNSTAVSFGATGSEDAKIYNDSTSFQIKNSRSKPTIFYTNNIERMRLDTSSNLLLNTTSSPTTAAGVIAMGNSTAPTASITGGVIYVSGGALYYRGSSGTVTLLANA